MCVAQNKRQLHISPLGIVYCPIDTRNLQISFCSWSVLGEFRIFIEKANRYLQFAEFTNLLQIQWCVLDENLQCKMNWNASCVLDENLVCKMNWNASCLCSIYCKSNGNSINILVPYQETWLVFAALHPSVPVLPPSPAGQALSLSLGVGRAVQAELSG